MGSLEYLDSAPGQIVQPLPNMLIGHFDGRPVTDIIGQMKSTDDALTYFYMSSAGKSFPAKRSTYTVR